MRIVLILTDKEGWHYDQLKKSFEKYNFITKVSGLEKLSISISGNNSKVTDSSGKCLDVTDVFVRHIPGGSLEEIIHSLNILKVFKANNVNIINSAECIETTVDKSLTSIKLKAAGINTPNTWIMRGKDQSRVLLEDLLQKHSLIYKPLFGSQGDNIIKITNINDFEKIINETNIYYFQEFIQTEPSHDYRVLICKNQNKVVTYTMLRQGNDYINNISKGAKCFPVKNDKDIIEIALRASEVIDIPFCGVDIIKGNNTSYVIELNSIPAWRGIQSISNDIISDEIIKTFFVDNNDSLFLQN